MNDIQYHLMTLVEELDDICSRNGIKYWMCGGCSIGIERHDGFIPWDDDVDLFITRSDYIKLDKILSESIAPDRAWVTQDNYPEYANPLPRYIDLNTTQLLRSRLADGTPFGQAVEFFVLDPFPSDPDEQLEYRKYQWVYCELQATRFMIANSSRYEEVDEDLYNYYAERAEKEGKEKILKEIEEEHLTYPEENCEYYIARWGVHDSIVKREWVDNIIYRDFEGFNVPFFKDNIEYLFYTEYGYNWNELPPKKSRGGHSGTAYTFLDKPYDMYLDEVTEMVRESDFDEYLQIDKQKNLQLKFLDIRQQRAEAVEYHALLEEWIRKSEKNFGKFDWRKLEWYASQIWPYMNLQFTKRYYLTKSRAAISDEFLLFVIQYLTFSNRIDDAIIITDLYRNKSVAREQRKIIDDICEMKIRKYEGNVERTAELVESLSADPMLAHQLEVERTAMWLQVQKDKQDPKAEGGSPALRRNLENSNDLEVLKYLGDYWYDRGETTMADFYYSKVGSTRNGMILKDLVRKGFLNPSVV